MKKTIFILFNLLLLEVSVSAQNTPIITPTTPTITDTIADAILYHYYATTTAGELINSAARSYSSSDILLITSILPSIPAIVVANNPGLLPDGSEKNFYTFCGITSGIILLASLVNRFIGHSNLEKAGRMLNGVRITNNGVVIDL